MLELAEQTTDLPPQLIASTLILNLQHPDVDLPVKAVL